MGKYFMDLDSGDIGFAFDDYGINSKGESLMRVGDNMFTNLDTGEVHFADSWSDKPDDDLFDDDLDDDSFEDDLDF